MPGPLDRGPLLRRAAGAALYQPGGDQLVGDLPRPAGVDQLQQQPHSALCQGPGGLGQSAEADFRQGGVFDIVIAQQGDPAGNVQSQLVCRLEDTQGHGVGGSEDRRLREGAGEHLPGQPVAVGRG